LDIGGIPRESDDEESHSREVWEFSHMIVDPMPGITVIRPEIHPLPGDLDDRGNFVEVYQAERLAQLGVNVTFVQDNYSRSHQHALRGLDYQIPHSQGKLVFVTRGKILDVVVDMRLRSPGFGKWSSYELDDEQMHQIYIPPGFAHGYCVLSEGGADVIFKCTDYYHPDDQHCMKWDDPKLGIDWRVKSPILSPRQQTKAVSFEAAERFP